MSNKGLFKPRNPQKYVGRLDMIVWRSGMELQMMSWLDKHPHVLQWASEEIKISYYLPLDGRWHYYYPDFLVKMKRPNGEETIIVEIKPSNQVKKPKKPKKTKNPKIFLNESFEWEKNQAKWKAATAFAEKNGWTFKIITEVELGLNWKRYGK